MLVLHRNLLLPCDNLPFETVPGESSRADSVRKARLTQRNAPISFPSSSSSEDWIIHPETEVSPVSSAGGYDTAGLGSGLNPEAEEFVPTQEQVDPLGIESDLS